MLLQLVSSNTTGGHVSDITLLFVFWMLILSDSSLVALQGFFSIEDGLCVCGVKTLLFSNMEG